MVCEAILCTGRDEEELATAEAGARYLVAFYGATPAYRPVLEVHGWGELQTDLHGLSKQGRWSEMAALVDDEVLRRPGDPGDPEGGGRRDRRAATTASRTGSRCTSRTRTSPDLIADVAAAVTSGARS